MGFWFGVFCFVLVFLGCLCVDVRFRGFVFRDWGIAFGLFSIGYDWKI